MSLCCQSWRRDGEANGFRPVAIELPMIQEDRHTDRESLRTFNGKVVNRDAFAKDYVCLASWSAGRLLICKEDGDRRWRRYRLSGLESKGQSAGNLS